MEEVEFTEELKSLYNEIEHLNEKVSRERLRIGRTDIKDISDDGERFVVESLTKKRVFVLVEEPLFHGAEKLRDLLLDLKKALKQSQQIFNRDYVVEPTA